MAETDPKGPLVGVKVLDFTIYQNGPSATGRLAELGAEVLKVEPDGGEPVRLNPSFISAKTGFNSGFEAFNRGKKSITIDLKHEKAKDIVKRLVQWADVLCENFKVGVLDRLGFSYEVCSGWNPRLIYCQNSGSHHELHAPT